VHPIRMRDWRPKLQNLRIVLAETRFGSQADASDVPA